MVQQKNIWKYYDEWKDNPLFLRDVAEMLELITFIRKWQGDIE